MRKPSRGDDLRGNDRWPTGRLDLRVVLVFGVDSVSCNWGGRHPVARCGLRAQSREIPARSDSREPRDWPARLGSRLCVTQRHLSLTGANVAAVFLEARTLSRDQQGLRLGDRLAMTQVVDGYGAKDLALDIQALLENSATQFGVSTGRRRRRAPARVDRAA